MITAMAKTTDRDRKPGIVGVNVRRIRESLKLKQEQVAERAGLTRETISRLEAGHEVSPKQPTVAALALALGCKPADLWREGDEMLPATPREPEPQTYTLQGFADLMGHELAKADLDDLHDFEGFTPSKGMSLGDWLRMRDRLRAKRTPAPMPGKPSGGGSGEPSTKKPG